MSTAQQDKEIEFIEESENLHPWQTYRKVPGGYTAVVAKHKKDNLPSAEPRKRIRKVFPDLATTF